MFLMTLGEIGKIWEAVEETDHVIIGKRNHLEPHTGIGGTPPILAILSSEG